jgi:hypothetical protein
MAASLILHAGLSRVIWTSDGVNFRVARDPGANPETSTSPDWRQPVKVDQFRTADDPLGIRAESQQSDRHHEMLLD